MVLGVGLEEDHWLYCRSMQIGHCTHPGLFAPQNVHQFQRSNSLQNHARCRRSDSTLFSIAAIAQFKLYATKYILSYVKIPSRLYDMTKQLFTQRTSMTSHKPHRKSRQLTRGENAHCTLHTAHCTANEHQPAIPSLANACMHACARTRQLRAFEKRKKQSKAKSNLPSSHV